MWQFFEIINCHNTSSFLHVETVKLCTTMTFSVFRVATIIWKNISTTSPNHRLNLKRNKFEKQQYTVIFSWAIQHQQCPSTSSGEGKRASPGSSPAGLDAAPASSSPLPPPSAFTDLLHIRGHRAGEGSWFCFLYNKDFKRLRKGTSMPCSAEVHFLIFLRNMSTNKKYYKCIQSPLVEAYLTTILRT